MSERWDLDVSILAVLPMPFPGNAMHLFSYLHCKYVCGSIHTTAFYEPWWYFDVLDVCPSFWTLHFPELCCMAAEMQKDTEHTYFFSCFCWYFDHVHRRKELGMILHRLRRCVTGNAGGIMSGTKYDMVQSVTSLKYTRGRIMNLSCEKTVFSPVWHQLVNWNSAALHSSNYYLNWELLPPCTSGNPHCSAYLAACKLLSNFEYHYFWFPLAVVF